VEVKQWLPSEVEAAAVRLLGDQWDDRDLAARLGPALLDAFLHWTPPAAPVAAIDTLVAYAFGNRIEPDNTVTPGPMNELLADTVASLVGARPGIPIHAQWEVAAALGDRHGIVATAIEPPPGPDGASVYLTTRDVAKRVVARFGSRGLGTVGVVAWRDHHYRCVATSRAAGMDAVAPAGVTMPCAYDPGSGQPWTRDRASYLVHDVLGRLIEARPHH
jgi:hypothetical protein